MLLTPVRGRAIVALVPLVALAAQMLWPQTGVAQSRRLPSPSGDSARGPVVIASLRAPVARSTSGVLSAWEACCFPFQCTVPSPHSTVRPATVEGEHRTRYALTGMLLGAAAGWGVYAWQCSHGSDCYSPVGGILIAVGGGIVGLLVGLLLAPSTSG